MRVMKIEILKPIIINNKSCKKGDVIHVSDSAGKIYVNKKFAKKVKK